MAEDTYTAALVGSGARLDAATGRAASFGDPAKELTAVLVNAVLADRSDFGRVLSTGRDILDLTHRLSTQDLKDLPPGVGRTTVLTTAKGRIIERLFVFALEPGRVLFIGSRQTGSPGKVIAHFTRHTFSEDTALEDETGSTRLLVLCGPAARAIAAQAALPAPGPLACESARIGSDVVRAFGVDPDGGDGISFVVPVERAAAIWQELLNRLGPVGAGPAGDAALEARRVIAALPAAEHELTEEYNPLEMGLWDAVSFTKGCYVGQEVVARLRTYDKVSRRLVGLSLDAGAAVPLPRTPVFQGEKQVGALTSALVPPGRSQPIALACIKRQALSAGSELRIGAPDGPAVTDVRQLPEAPHAGTVA